MGRVLSAEMSLHDQTDALRRQPAAQQTSFVDWPEDRAAADTGIELADILRRSADLRVVNSA